MIAPVESPDETSTCSSSVGDVCSSKVKDASTKSDQLPFVYSITYKLYFDSLVIFVSEELGNSCDNLSNLSHYAPAAFDEVSFRFWYKIVYSYRFLTPRIMIIAHGLRQFPLRDALTVFDPDSSDLIVILPEVVYGSR
ncbi:MAG: hypothetical protein EZS28_032463 [Streblomastix strix]|uniref:Uncharacterized protein n=1 Tax=Streblomastix strix TaxID=222440 RepID=A0A5J4UPP8_9EUKA|nr:MAG: hypothetical protein EZS28_032463 [Streblomastix strix]